MPTAQSQIQAYPTWSRADLISRLAKLVTELSATTQEYYRMQANETRTKAEAFIQSAETTIAGRERDVSLSTYNTTASVLETRGYLDALKEERQFILFLLAEGI